MAVAQALYHGKDVGGGERVGLITYMRTDSLNVAESAQAEARQLILERYGEAYLPPQPPQYKSRAKGAQEAHEAIRPTSVRRDPAALKEYLTRDELRLYTLIWKRFVASQMQQALVDQNTISIEAGAYLFTVSGSSNSMAATSFRTSPRPNETFCLVSADKPAAFLLRKSVRSSIFAISCTRRSTLLPGTPRFRKGKAKLSKTVIVSYKTGN